MTSSPDSAEDVEPTIVPQPSNLAAEPGRFDLTRLKAIQIDGENQGVRQAAFHLARELSNRLGRFVRCAALDADASQSDGNGCIRVGTVTKNQLLGTDVTEGYDLDIKKDFGSLAAPNPSGLLRGIESLLQLIMPDSAGGYCLPIVRVVDKPSTSWRGVRLDLRFAAPPLGWLERFVGLLGLLRLNALRLVLATGSTPTYGAAQLTRIQEAATERGIELLCETTSLAPGEPTEEPSATQVFQVVRLSAGDKHDSPRVVAEELKPDEESALPSVNGIWWLKPEAAPLEAERKWFGLEAWLRWPSGIAPAILERAFTSRLAAFAELAWTGPFRRTFVDFRHRLGNLFRDLDRLGFDYDVPPPGGLPDTVFFDDEVAIELVPPCPGAGVQYSLDGKDPGTNSPFADKPLFLREECVVRARTRLRNGKVSAPITIEVRRRPEN